MTPPISGLGCHGTHNWFGFAPKVHKFLEWYLLQKTNSFGQTRPTYLWLRNGMAGSVDARRNERDEIRLMVTGADGTERDMVSGVTGRFVTGQAAKSGVTSVLDG
ncbi:unnamed protein product [Allacma fusca]|uniref:Uncharacterized protein n=1 Tax=Allacma fusca TaxID=39272 RepID=A0A8J2K1X4_9HEXA|nr:unnamed protein product [Allacma fusca]